MARNRAELGPATIPLRHELAEFSTENDSHNDSRIARVWREFELVKRVDINGYRMDSEISELRGNFLERRINLVEKLFRSRNVIEVNDEKQVVGCDLIIVESFCLIKFCWQLILLEGRIIKCVNEML